MNLDRHVERLHQQLAAATGAATEEAQDLARRLTASLDAAARLVLLEALSVAAEEITTELAPGAVDLRIRGGEAEFVVTPPPSEQDFEDIAASDEAHAPGPTETEDGGTARLNLRLPETFKLRIEEAARAEGLSLNAWLVRAAGAALDATSSRRRPTGGDRYTGWIR